MADSEQEVESLRDEFYTDPQGRRVRAKHAAKFPDPGSEDGQKTLWDDIRTAYRPFMERAFKGRRNQIVGDCVQLSMDVGSYNDNKCMDDPIPMLFDFREDVAEAAQSGKLEEQPEEAAFEESDLATTGDAPFSLHKSKRDKGKVVRESNANPTNDVYPIVSPPPSSQLPSVFQE